MIQLLKNIIKTSKISKILICIQNILRTEVSFKTSKKVLRFNISNDFKDIILKKIPLSKAQILDQINIFDIFDVFMIFLFRLYHLKSIKNIRI